MLGSAPSVMSCTRPSPLARRAANEGENTTAMSARWQRMSRSAEAAVGAVPTRVKCSVAASSATSRRVRWSAEAVTTTVRTSFTSVRTAKPSSNIIITGIPKRMSIVRRSRTMWRVSLPTKDRKVFIVVVGRFEGQVPRVASRAKWVNTLSMSGSP